mgnify:CR=1 FL=1
MTNIDNLVINWQIYRDQTAATQLFELVKGVKFAIIHKYAKTVIAASEYESIANRAFVDAISTFDFSVEFKSYFATILRRKIVSFWRKKRVNTDNLSDNVVVVAPQYSDISEYCALLSPINAKVIYLKFVEGKTDKEIASQLGTSRSTVTTINNKSLEQLRAALAI